VPKVSKAEIWISSGSCHWRKGVRTSSIRNRWANASIRHHRVITENWMPWKEEFPYPCLFIGRKEIKESRNRTNKFGHYWILCHLFGSGRVDYSEVLFHGEPVVP